MSGAKRENWRLKNDRTIGVVSDVSNIFRHGCLAPQRRISRRQRTDERRIIREKPNRPTRILSYTPKPFVVHNTLRTLRYAVVYDGTFRGNNVIGPSQWILCTFMVFCDYWLFLPNSTLAAATSNNGNCFLSNAYEPLESSANSRTRFTDHRHLLLKALSL